MNLEVSATDRHTVALALVSILEGDDDGDVIDLTPEEVQQVLTVFPPPGRGEEGTLEVAVTDTKVIITDVAGLIAGKALTLTRRTHETYPELRRLFAGRLQPSADPTGEVWFHATTLKRFAAAQRAYEYPLVFHRVPAPGRSWVVRCGDSFVALVSPVRQDEDAQLEANRWRDDWDVRLGPADGDPAEAWDWLVQGAATYSGTAPADDVDDQPDGGERPGPRVTLHVPEWGDR